MQEGKAFQEREAMQVVYGDLRYEFYAAPSPDGVTQASFAITLPRNALVRKYELVLTAAPAHAVTAAEAGQVRTTDGISVVIDFGTPRTVRSVEAPAGVVIKSISTWAGTEFTSTPKYDDGKTRLANLPSEVRTERLLLVVSPKTATDTLATGVTLVVPESPSGLELRIDGAAPVFAQVAAVDPGNSSDLSKQSWNSEGKRVVDIASALAALTGNPLDESNVTFNLTLTSRTAGQLEIALNPGGQEVLRIRRATFNSQASRDVSFALEGRQELTLDSLPSGLTVSEIRLSVLGKPPEQRTLPPLGPDPPNPPFAQITLTPNRAACVRLPLDTRFGDLGAVRLPLAVPGAGAEARLVLWQSRDNIDSSPAELVPNGTSEPVSLQTGDETWCTFSWKKPIAPPKNVSLWGALVLDRGEATLTFASAASGTGAETLLWGAPSGPWHDLPASLSAVRARVRVVGRPKPESNFAPLLLQHGSDGAELPVLPNPKGVPAQLSGTRTWSERPALVLTSYGPASLTLQNIDVVSTG